ncbi:PorP/SprF family type IX secretion system membrane protein [Halocola ammonii]
MSWAKKTYRLVFITLGIVISTSAGAQQEWLFTQHSFNLYDVNAAYAGNYNGLATAIRYRDQWTGLDGAPNTQQISLHCPIQRDKFGVGLQVRNESIGARNQFSAKLGFSYKIKFAKGMLSFGLQAGALQQTMKVSELTAKDESDIYLLGGDLSSLTPTTDAALFFNTSKFYIGVQGTHIFPADLVFVDGSNARSYYHLNAVVGRVFTLSEKWKLKPFAMLRMAENVKPQAEGFASVLYDDILWIGAGYRQNFGPSFFTEWNVTKRFRVGYSFDLLTNPLEASQTGSHEIFLGYNFQFRKSAPSIRYF